MTTNFYEAYFNVYKNINNSKAKSTIVSFNKNQLTTNFYDAYFNLINHGT